MSLPKVISLSSGAYQFFAPDRVILQKRNRTSPTRYRALHGIDQFWLLGWGRFCKFADKLAVSVNRLISSLTQIRLTIFYIEGYCTALRCSEYHCCGIRSLRWSRDQSMNGITHCCTVIWSLHHSMYSVPSLDKYFIISCT